MLGLASILLKRKWIEPRIKLLGLGDKSGRDRASSAGGLCGGKLAHSAAGAAGLQTRNTIILFVPAGHYVRRSLGEGGSSSTSSEFRAALRPRAALLTE